MCLFRRLYSLRQILLRTPYARSDRSSPGKEQKWVESRLMKLAAMCASSSNVRGQSSECMLVRHFRRSLCFFTVLGFHRATAVCEDGPSFASATYHGNRRVNALWSPKSVEVQRTQCKDANYEPCSCRMGFLFRFGRWLVPFESGIPHLMKFTPRISGEHLDTHGHISMALAPVIRLDTLRRVPSTWNSFLSVFLRRPFTP
ncbi:hypothetical protein BDZ89DRAFT_290322 [Hymenopellis radicata]|nr:hypothetical protein BDZ89DRAFT_290322 [Hymenopellis radicata]